MQEAVVQCLECMHDQPHLGFHNGRVEPIEDRWERMIAGTPWVASCTVTVDADDVETCSGPEAGDALSYAAFGDHGTREFFTHVRFHKHDEDRIVVHLLVELYARSAEEATEVLEDAAPRHARDHLARRGVAAAGVDRRRAALSRPLGRHGLRSARSGAQRHRHGRRQLADDEEQQVEQRGDRRTSAAPRGSWRRRFGGQHRTEQRGHEQIAVAHRHGPEQLALKLRQAAAGCAATSVAFGAWSRSETTSQVSAPAIATIPSFSQPGGVTAASSTPSVTQLSADSSAAGRLAGERCSARPRRSTNSGIAAERSERPATRATAQPSAAAASGGTATSAR